MFRNFAINLFDETQIIPKFNETFTTKPQELN